MERLGSSERSIMAWTGHQPLSMGSLFRENAATKLGQ